MRPSIWEEDDSGKGSGPDILAEERERRLRRRRGIRAFFPSSWLTGRAGVFILVVFLLGGLGWLGFQRWGDADRLGPGSGSPSFSSPVPERARDLTASEYSLASRYGRPLYFGTEGVPVVQVEGTGKVRELTPFELGVRLGVHPYPVVAGSGHRGSRPQGLGDVVAGYVRSPFPAASCLL